jgi:hypothetical protein
MASIEDEINAYRNRMWFTRKAWIIAEARLLANEMHAQSLMVFYSIYSACVSILLLKYSALPQVVTKVFREDIANIFSATFSIILLCLSLHLGTKSFKERAKKFKGGYIEMQSINDELGLALISGTNLPDCFTAARKRYEKILDETENHSEFDDLYSRFSAGTGLNSRLLTKLDLTRLVLYYTKRKIFISFFYAMPIIVIGCLFFFG